MEQKENLGSFLKDNKDLLKEYLETRYEILRLKSIAGIAKAAGALIWFFIAALLGLLILLFGGFTLGFWLSRVFENEVTGFGITALILLAVLGILAAFRQSVFINPVIRIIISKSRDEDDEPAD
jgi:hypothetical protein